MFDVIKDPHEQADLFNTFPEVAAVGRDLLETWTEEQLKRSYSPVDPMQIVLEEGGPFHTRGHLPQYLQRLEETGRSNWAEVLRQRHPKEAG